jgi:glycosyltransferase involved in cell wall biosynthesis
VTTVSVVIPVFNQAQYIGDTIKSVLSQSYAVHEIIIVDDGSSDESGAIARSFGSCVEVLSQDNAGQAVALNRGWSRCTGSLIGYLGSDDLYDPALVETLVAASHGLARPVVVFPNYRDIDSAGVVVRRNHPPASTVAAMAHAFRCDIGPGALFSREIFRYTGGWDVRFRQIPDFEFWLRAAKFAEFRAVPEVLASWRIHAGSQTMAVSSREKADEPLLLGSSLATDPARYFEGIDPVALQASGALLSACLHFRSRRFGTGFKTWRRAVELDWRRNLSPAAMARVARTAVAGIAGR